MARPCKNRCVKIKIKKYSLKPSGLSLKRYLNVEIRADEVETLRLSDYQGMYQEDAAKLMNISRQTFARIVRTARKKIADALVNGKIINISCCGPVELKKPLEPKSKAKRL